jgi:predicted regulator of Ras-like GTPase activity (Roadblock/LC7/MglB family)
MQTILERINSVPGVTASLVCDAEGQVVASLSSVPIDEEALAVAGRAATQTAMGIQTARRGKFRQMDVIYKAMRLIVRSMQTGFLCILCVPQTNIPLLDLTIAGATLRLPEMIELRATEPVARSAPEPGGELATLSQFIEALVGEMGDRGIGREQLLSILARRLERLQAALPALAAVATGGGRVDLAALQARPSSEMAQVVAVVATAICQTCIGMLGQEATASKYRQVYESFRVQNGQLLRSLGLDQTLDKADSMEGGPLPGIEFKL